MSQKLKCWRKLGIFLYRRKIKARKLRLILQAQFVFSLAILLIGLILFKKVPWIFWFGIGSCLAMFNFFSLTKFVPQIMLKQYSIGIGFSLFFHSQIRLLATAVFVCIVHVLWGASVLALLAGLSMILISIILCVKK